MFMQEEIVKMIKGELLFDKELHIDALNFIKWLKETYTHFNLCEFSTLLYNSFKNGSVYLTYEVIHNNGDSKFYHHCMNCDYDVVDEILSRNDKRELYDYFLKTNRQHFDSVFYMGGSIDITIKSFDDQSTLFNRIVPEIDGKLSRLSLLNKVHSLKFDSLYRKVKLSKRLSNYNKYFKYYRGCEISNFNNSKEVYEKIILIRERIKDLETISIPMYYYCVHRPGVTNVSPGDDNSIAMLKVIVNDINNYHHMILKLKDNIYYNYGKSIINYSTNSEIAF